MGLWAGVIISLGSLIVAIIVMRRRRHAQIEASALQRRVLEIEQRREQDRRLASLQAQMLPEIRHSPNGSYRLLLLNQGMAEARNLRVLLDGVQPGVRGESLPSQVGAGGEVSCLLGISHQCAPPFQCEVLWDDDSGTDRSYRTTLTW